MEPDCRITLRTKPKEEATGRFLILALMGVSPLQYFNWRNPCCRIEAICGSDLHLYDWFIPTKEARDIPGHEFMGVVEDMCRDVTNLKRGDRLVVHFTIACLQEEDLVKV
jgi:hypothetical protein